MPDKYLTLDEYDQKKHMTIDQYDSLAQQGLSTPQLQQQPPLFQTAIPESTLRPEIQAATTMPMFRPTPGIEAQEQRSFAENMQESYKRGGRSAELDVMMAEASVGLRDYDKVKKIKKEYEKRLQADPIKADNWLSNALHKVAEMAAPMAQGTLEGITTGATLAGGAAIAGQAGPQALTPEELVTMPGAFGVGTLLGSSQFWYRQGVGTMYDAIRDSGVDHNIASVVSQIAALPYAAIEYSQASKIIPGLKQTAKNIVAKTTKRAIGRMAKKYGANWIENVAEEGLQEVVTIIAEEGSKAISNSLKNKGIDHIEITENLTRVWQTLSESALPMALMLLPGTVASTSKAVREVEPEEPKTSYADQLKTEKEKIQQQNIINLDEYDKQQEKVKTESKTEPEIVQKSTEQRQIQEIAPKETKTTPTAKKPLKTEIKGISDFKEFLLSKDISEKRADDIIENPNASRNYEEQNKLKSDFIKQKPKEKVAEKAEKVTKVTNQKEFVKQLKDEFQIDDKEAENVGTIADALIETSAKREGKTKDQVYGEWFAEIKRSDEPTTPLSNKLYQEVQKIKEADIKPVAEIPVFTKNNSTHDAVKVGLGVKGNDKLIAELKRKHEQGRIVFKNLMRDKKIQEAHDTAYRNQLYREAYEVATNTGSMKDVLFQGTLQKAKIKGGKVILPEEFEPTADKDELLGKLERLYAGEIKLRIYENAKEKRGGQLSDKSNIEYLKVKNELKNTADSALDDVKDVFKTWLRRHESPESWFDEMFSEELYGDPKEAFTDKQIGYINYIGADWQIDVREEIIEKVNEELGIEQPGTIEELRESLEDSVSGDEIEEMMEMDEDELRDMWYERVEPEQDGVPEI